MNVYAQEVLNRFGEEILKNIQAEFPNGFHIVGGDVLEVIVGDKSKNVVFSRKTLKAIKTYSFSTGPKKFLGKVSRNEKTHGGGVGWNSGWFWFSFCCWL